MPLQENRGTAISNWFKSHRDLNIISFVILDDWNDMGIYKNHLVWTDSTYGLTNHNVREAIKILRS